MVIVGSEATKLFDTFDTFKINFPPGGERKNVAGCYIHSQKPLLILSLDIKRSIFLIMKLQISLLHIVIGDFPTICFVN